MLARRFTEAKFRQKEELTKLRKRNARHWLRRLRIFSLKQYVLVVPRYEILQEQMEHLDISYTSSRSMIRKEENVIAEELLKD